LIFNHDARYQETIHQKFQLTKEGDNVALGPITPGNDDTFVFGDTSNSYQWIHLQYVMRQVQGDGVIMDHA